MDDLMAVARAVGLTTHGSASTGANSDSLRRKFQILDSLRRKSLETNENVSAHTDVQFCNSCNPWVKSSRHVLLFSIVHNQSRKHSLCHPYQKDNYSSDKDVLSDRKCHLYLLLFVLVMVQILFSLFCEKPFLYQRQIKGLHIRRHLAKLLYLTYKILHRFC